jgi:transcriptional regulator with XRE-family HTH domain
MPAPIPARRAALGARLRELRAVRYRSGSAFARDLGWPQTKVSKIERGAQLPSQGDLDAWVATTGADDRVAAELRTMLGAARLDYRVWTDAWRMPGGIAAAQDEIADLDMAATRLAEYQPAMVPGLVQTPAYAREVLAVAGGASVLGGDAAQIDGRIAAQLRRQQVLYAPGKRIELVIGEAALRTTFGERVTLVGQLDRLLQLAGLPTVTLGVLAFDQPAPVPPLAGFAVNDSAIVWVETLTGEQRLDDPEEVAAYVTAFDVALAAAAVGDHAADLIRRAMAALAE